MLVLLVLVQGPDVTPSYMTALTAVLLQAATAVPDLVQAHLADRHCWPPCLAARLHIGNVAYGKCPLSCPASKTSLFPQLAQGPVSLLGHVCGLLKLVMAGHPQGSQASSES